MIALLIFLVVLWIVLGIVGVVIEGLFWLLVVAVVLLVATVLFGRARVRGGR